MALLIVLFFAIRTARTLSLSVPMADAEIPATITEDRPVAFASPGERRVVGIFHAAPATVDSHVSLVAGVRPE